MSLIDVILDAQEPWRKDAACRDHPEVNFFPKRNESTKAAKRLCAHCLVTEECRRYGSHDKHGIWGGTTPRQRRMKRSAA